MSKNHFGSRPDVENCCKNMPTLAVGGARERAYENPICRCVSRRPDLVDAILAIVRTFSSPSASRRSCAQKCHVRMAPRPEKGRSWAPSAPLRGWHRRPRRAPQSSTQLSGGEPHGPSISFPPALARIARPISERHQQLLPRVAHSLTHSFTISVYYKRAIMSVATNKNAPPKARTLP